MNINSLFPSNFLKADDLEGKARQVVITVVTPEELGSGESKPVARFEGLDQGLVLNKTNSMVLASALGTETDLWVGKMIELYPDKVNFQGQVKDCIRVRVPIVSAQPIAAPTQPATVLPAGNNLNDGNLWA